MSNLLLGQFLPPLDEQDAGVADLAGTPLVQTEAVLEVRLVTLAVGEARARRLGAADAASLHAAIDLGLVKTEHDDGQLSSGTNSS